MLQEALINDEFHQSNEVESSHPQPNSRPVRESRDNARFRAITESAFPSKGGHRRKIYNDAEFKEVVQNFYDLITEINRSFKESKKGTKRILKKPNNRAPDPKMAVHQRFKKPKLNPPESRPEPSKKPDLYRYKNDKSIEFGGAKGDPFLQMQMKSSNLGSILGGQFYAGNQYMMLSGKDAQQTMPPFMFEPQLHPGYRTDQFLGSQKLQKRGQFGRNAYHVAIAYHIYMANVSQNKQPNDIINIEQHYDPTTQARRMRDTKKGFEPKKSDEVPDSELILILKNETEEKELEANVPIVVSIKKKNEECIFPANEDLFDKE